MTTSTNKPSKKGLARVIDATQYSLQGLRAAFANEAAFRQECILFLVSIPLAFWIAHSVLLFAALIGVGLIVLLAEILNSAIEAIVDLASPKRHELAGRAKDMGSAGVFIALALFVLVWGAAIISRIV